MLIHVVSFVNLSLFLSNCIYEIVLDSQCELCNGVLKCLCTIKNH